jgi:serine/threonine protein kinase
VRSGDVIAGRYRLEEAVGAGGMGEVWRATDLELRRVVALKRATTGDSGETRREARIGAGLHHPNVISVFDVVVEDDQRWLVMEYLPARSLTEVCRADGPIAPDLAARVGAQIAAALAAMHAKGMVHRDITQANILVTEDGTAKLADLGVAMWDQVTLTGSAKTAGTPGYVAPEVMAGHRATPAADLYSLGVTLSASVEGHPETDERFTGVLARLTDPDPTHRPTADEATRLLGGTSNRRPSRTLLVAAGAVLAAALVTTFLVTSAGEDGTAEPPVSSGGAVPPAGNDELLFGVGDQIDKAMATELVRESPIGMLTTTYHKPSDLTKLQSWQDTLVPDAYAEGYALQLIVSNWQEDDPETTFQTSHGLACGRPHPLSNEFLDHMRTLATIFAGKADGPRLYVTVFNEVNKFACEDGSYSGTPESVAYYEALMDRYLEVQQLFKDIAPNAQVALGWDDYQVESDHPEVGGGKSMFEHFARVLEVSDYQAVLVKLPYGNIDQVRQSVRILGGYGKVMVAAYGRQDTSGEVVESDLRTLLANDSIADLTESGLFAWSFNNETVPTRAGRSTLDFVKDVIRRTGAEPR